MPIPPAIDPASVRLLSAFERAARVIGGLAILVCCGVILGWMFDLPLLQTMVPGGPAMRPCTALALLFVAAALVAGKSRPRLLRALGIAALLVGLTSLVEVANGTSPALGERPLSPTMTGFDALDPGNISPPTALGVFLLGCALLAAALQQGAVFSQILSLLGAAPGLIATTGYLYGAPPLHEFAGHPGMAPHTALLLTGLGLAIPVLSLERGPLRILLSQSDGGRLARWLTPGALLVPLIGGRLKLAGLQSGLYGNTFSAALFFVVTAAMFLALVWSVAHVLAQMDLERQAAQNAARISDARFRRLVDSNILGVFTTESDGRITEANNESLRICGYSREELLAGQARWNASAFQNHELPNHDASPSGTHSDGVAPPWESDYIRPDGTHVPILMGAAVLNEPGNPTIAFTLDLSRRKHAEAERDRFFTLSLDLLCVAGTDGFFRRLNPAFERTLGYSQEELLGQPFIRFVHAEDRESTLRVVAQLACGENTVDFENRYLCKDASLRWLLWTAAATPDGTIFAAARDITERKQAEEEIKRTVAELARSNAELEQFASIASHDLQEPLRAVASCVHLLRQRYTGRLDAQADELIGHVFDGATRMKALINDLIAYSRVGRQDQPFEPVDLQACLSDVLSNLRDAIGKSHARILCDPMPPVRGNAPQLTRLFQNLLGNALKFCRDHSPEIHVSAQRSERAWTFAIRDNGIGIEPKHFERIFGVFQRLHTQREFEGTGVGLAVCKKIVERHAGQLWVESAPGKGSTFFFTLADSP